MKPAIGQIVLYALTADDVARINLLKVAADPMVRANPHSEGQLVPLVVVVVWPNEFGPDFDGVNGQALIDGNASLWITSAKEGTIPGTWQWLYQWRESSTAHV